MIVFSAQPYYKRFAEALGAQDSEVQLGRSQLIRYPDGELCASAHQGVAGQDCLLVGTIAPPDNQLIEFLMLADAIKRGGARSLWAFLPYLAYARQDKFAVGQAGGIETIGALCRAAGLDGIATIDLHSELDSRLIGLPVLSLLPANLFAREIQRLGWPNVTIVAPDEGGIHRNETLAETLGVHGSVVHLVKKRTSIVHLGVVGDVGEQVVIADDILDSGRTLVSACNVLHQHGVKDIAIAVTHGLFTGAIWRELFGLGIRALFVTDSCPSALKTEEPEVRVISIKPMLETVLAAIRKEVRSGLVSA